MTPFTKFGNWFLRNSRNVFLIFIINYLVMIQIGFNFLGGGLLYLLTGNLTETLKKMSSYDIIGIQRYLWALTASTLIHVLMSFIIYIFCVFVFVIVNLIRFKRLVFYAHGLWLWVLVGSQWLMFILYFASSILHFLWIDEDATFLNTVVYAACYSLIPILFSIIFWYFLTSAYRNFSSQKQEEDV